MSTVSITRRERKSGPRWVVRYRLGGRDTPVRHDSVHSDESDARIRAYLLRRTLDRYCPSDPPC